MVLGYSQHLLYAGRTQVGRRRHENWYSDSNPSHKSEKHRNGTPSNHRRLQSGIGSMETRGHGKAPFHQFIMDTYEELYSMESKQLLAKSSIGIFVRFDVAFDSGSEKPARHICVNEVERTQTTTLWSNRLKAKSSTAPTGIFGYTLAEKRYIIGFVK